MVGLFSVFRESSIQKGSFSNVFDMMRIYTDHNSISRVLGFFEDILPSSTISWVLSMSFLDVDECIFCHDCSGFSCHFLRIPAVPPAAFCCFFVPPGDPLAQDLRWLLCHLLACDLHLVLWEMHTWDSLSRGMILFLRLRLVLCCPASLLSLDYIGESDMSVHSVLQTSGGTFRALWMVFWRSLY